MSVSLSENKVTKLGGIVAATLASPTQFEWHHPIGVNDLEKAGLVVPHPELRHEDGKQKAYRATQAGIEHYTGLTKPAASEAATAAAWTAPVAAAPVAAAPTPKPAPSFEIETGYAPSAKAAKRGGRRPDVYPFAILEVGQSFFVPSTAERPEPWKAMASTVNTAMVRYAVPKLDPTTGQPVQRTNRKGKVVTDTVRSRVFVLEKSEKNGVPGARVFRTA